MHGEPMFNDSLKASAQIGIQYSVLRLHSWPSLTDIDVTLAPDMARMCALLAIRPSSAMLLPRLLGISHERASQLMKMLLVQGHLDNVDPAEVEPVSTSSEPVPMPDEPRSKLANPASRLLGRLWDRLTRTKRQ